MKDSPSTNVNEHFERMILEAEIMLRSADPQQRERGREKLREVSNLAEGTVHAKTAIELLAASERPQPVSTDDPELEELTFLKSSIQGFNDHRLAGFLRRLESYQGTAMPIKTEVISQLQKWIVAELPKIGTSESSTKIDALNDFVAAVRGVAAFEELPEFGQLRDRLFQRRLQETADRIDSALAVWSPEEAQRALDDLNPFPLVFKASIDRLQAGIYEVDHLRGAVDRLLGKLPDHAPNSWFEARLQAETQAQLEQYRTKNRVPQDWRLRLDEAFAGLTEFISQFVRAQAQAAVTIQLLRDFWTEFERLRGENNSSPIQTDEHWFTDVGEALAAEARREVERAANVDELMTVANRFRADAEGVPPTITSRLTALSDTIGNIGSVWKSMQEGQSFVLPGNAQLPLPKALEADSPRYLAWVEQVEAALNSLISETPLPSEQDYHDRLQLAQGILAAVPHHALALKLQQETKRRLGCYQVDQALLSWNVESFFQFFETNSPSEIYSALARYKDVLVELRDLTRQSSLKNWRDAGEWRARWQTAANRLPVVKPDALVSALGQQESKRQSERYATLDKLLKDDFLPADYESAASSLDDESDPNLKSYQQELHRKATIGYIEEQIRSGELEDAAKKLESLTPTSTDAIRLRTRLEVEQSRLQGSVAAAEYLFQEWENIRTYVGQPEQLLLETIAAVWVEGEQDSVLKIVPLISRVLRDATDNQITLRLTEWQTWLEIEDGLLNNFSSGAVKQLTDYLRNAERGEVLDQRLKRVLGHWESEGNTLMLAWAYQAFQGVSTAAREFDKAADDLVRESDRVADGVEKVLAREAALSLEDLQALLASLEHEEDRWRMLEDFLSLVWHPVERRRPSVKFTQTKARAVEVSRVLTLLARLSDVDLRQDTERLAFNEADSRARRLKNVASQKRLIKELDRLRPLTEDLFFLQERIRETTELCRSKVALDVLKTGLFKKLVTYVENVVDIFVKAEAKGGKMWALVSAEYESKIFRDACVLLPVSGFCELDQLVNVLEELHAEELHFTEALLFLEDRDRQPEVAGAEGFDPKPHLDYLRLIPQQAPRSLKVYHRFERARTDPLKKILEAPASRPYLPVWVHNYLENGVPLCASGH